MSVQHLRLYMNNPTAGGVDGTEISSGDDTLPLNVKLNATINESKAVKVAVRCDSGYFIDGDVTIRFQGTNSSKWKVAADDSYADAETALSMAQWASTLTLANVAATNKIFWVKASSTQGENPLNDRTVKLVAEGLVAAAVS